MVEILCQFDQCRIWTGHMRVHSHTHLKKAACRTILLMALCLSCGGSVLLENPATSYMFKTKWFLEFVRMLNRAGLKASWRARAASCAATCAMKRSAIVCLSGFQHSVLDEILWASESKADNRDVRQQDPGSTADYNQED